MRALIAALGALLLAGCLSFEADEEAEAPAPRWSIVVHGGAGVIERANLSPEMDAQYRAAMHRALQTGGAILEGGGASLDAVEAVIREMEEDPLFNAGRGAVFTLDGKNELDASIMDGRARAAGAVAGVTRTRSPIALARRVMEQSPHVMLIGEGAEAFARTQRLEEVANTYFFTERRWLQLEQFALRNNLPLPTRPLGAPPPQQRSSLTPDDHQFGTVGVVAYDAHGNIAAGTSTGGAERRLRRFRHRHGRIFHPRRRRARHLRTHGVPRHERAGRGQHRDQRSRRDFRRWRRHRARWARARGVEHEHAGHVPRVARGGRRACGAHLC
jgi:isoaspartyl peptidase/L-asparaginase-like protein (Ntn-hydrolase superfamily)